MNIDTTRPLVIVGGSDAGISAGLRARELRPDLTPLLIVADAYPNYSICGLPFFLSGETPRASMLAHRTREDLEAAGLELLLEHEVTAIDPVAKTVRAEPTDGSPAVVIGYENVVLGTGAEPQRPPIRGLENEGVHVLHSMAQAFAVHDAVTSSYVQRVLIVGAGYIGLELADGLRHRGLEVSVVERLGQVFPTVDEEFAATIEDELRSHGVEVATGVTVSEIACEGGRLVVHADDGVARVADLVVVATGVRPVTDLAVAAGARTGVRGAVVVDRAMRTGVEGVFAAGDMVETWHALLGKATYLPLGTTSHKQGRVAGANAVGVAAEFAGSLGSQSVKLFDLVVARTGLRHDEAEAEGFAPVTVEIEADDHKAYYPGASKIRLRLTADGADGRLLGVQLLGRYGAEVSKRCDVLAVAIQLGLTVDQVSDLDLTYTPPLSSPWDPVAQVAQAWRRGR